MAFPSSFALENCVNPTEALETITLQNSADAGIISLYGLLTRILKARIVDSGAKSQQTMGVLLTTAPHRPLCEKAIADLAGARPNSPKVGE